MTLPLETIEETIRIDRAERVRKLQEKLKNAERHIVRNEASSESKSKERKYVADLLAPAKDIIDLLDALTELHPMIKIVVGAAQGVVGLELKRTENDKQIATVFHTMNNLLFTLSFLDPVFEREGGLQVQLEQYLENVCQTIDEFGNFCEHRPFVRMIWSSTYKEKLVQYASSFTEQKRMFDALLSQGSAVVITGLDVKTDRILAILNKKSEQERKAGRLIAEMGGLDSIITNNELPKLAEKLYGKVDKELKASVGQIARTVRADIDELLKDNMELFHMKLQNVVDQIDHSIQKSTRQILVKLEAGPHELIQDPDIQTVWKDMGSRISTKSRLFIDAIGHHFHNKFAQYHSETGVYHPHAWTLKILSKVLFYATIGEAMDQDSSGFVTVHEVNEFLLARPSSWSVPEWLAYWAAGPNISDLYYRRKIKILLEELKDAPTQTHNENRPRIQYLVTTAKFLDLIDISDRVLDYFGQSEMDIVYRKLEEKRVELLAAQETRIEENLKRAKYRLDGADSVSVIIGNGRLEHSIFCIIYVLLNHHLKIVRYATSARVSRVEFEDIAHTWSTLLQIFNHRLDNLMAIWRQQRSDADKQAEWYCGGLFNKWYIKRHNWEIRFDTGEDINDGDTSDNGDGDDDLTYQYEDGDDYDGQEANSAKTHTPDSPGSIGDHPQESVRDTNDILSYPVPDQPEDNDGFDTEDDDTFWEDRRNKLTLSEEGDNDINHRIITIEAKVSSIESRLGNIEGLLRQLLGQGSGVVPNSGEAPTIVTEVQHATLRPSRHASRNMSRSVSINVSRHASRQTSRNPSRRNTPSPPLFRNTPSFLSALSPDHYPSLYHRLDGLQNGSEERSELNSVELGHPNGHDHFDDDFGNTAESVANRSRSPDRENSLASDSSLTYASPAVEYLQNQRP